jgi:phage gp36-like protein
MSIIEKYNNTQPAQKKNQHVIEKIREQYQENIQTLKTMLKLEIQQCMDWAEEVCRFMEGRVTAMHERITSIEESLMKVHVELAEQSFEKKMKGK